MKDFDKKQFWIWALNSVFWFCIILFLGISMRLSFAIQIKLPTPFEYTRHAHSHTAFWAWAAPAFIGFILNYSLDTTKRSKVFEKLLFCGIQILSFFALISFLMSGYSKLSIVFSTLMVFLWLGFIIYFLRTVKQMRENQIVTLMIQLAVTMLFISTLPSFLIPLSIAFGFGGDSIKTILIHFFLDAYSEGWLYTMGFALFLSSSKDFLITKPNTYCKALFYLIIPIFILVCLRSSIFLFPKIFQILILATSFLWGVLQIIVILDFFSKGIESKIHFFVLFLVLCKASVDIAVSFPINTFFLQSKLFGILYLHIKLLGIMSVVILLFIFRMYFTISKYSLYSRIFLMIGVILSLMGMLLVAISSLVNGYNMNYVNNQQIWQIGQSFALLGGLSVLFSGGLNIYYLFIKRSLLVLANEN